MDFPNQKMKHAARNPSLAPPPPAVCDYSTNARVIADAPGPPTPELWARQVSALFSWRGGRSAVGPRGSRGVGCKEASNVRPDKRKQHQSSERERLVGKMTHQRFPKTEMLKWVRLSFTKEHSHFEKLPTATAALECQPSMCEHY